MSESEMRVVIYTEILNQMRILYGLTSDQEHEAIHEFFEGPLPVFKLILVTSDEGPGFTMVSFHIEVQAAEAIQWFLRIRGLEPNLRVGPCYLRDTAGTTYVGEDAQVLKLYMVEQDILSNYIQGTKDAEEIVNKELATKPSPLKTYSDYKIAINQFHKLTKKDGDIEH